MSVLVTGAGVIGTLTADLLAQRGDVVVVADIREPGILPGGCRFARCDVTDGPALEALISGHGITRIVHTAAMLSTAIRKDPVRGIAVNVMGTAAILDAARLLGVGRVVCASSTTVGYSTFGSFRGETLPEDIPLRLVSERPGSIYAATKIAGEHLALVYADLYGVDAVVLRYAAVIGGPLDAPTSVPGRLLAELVSAARSGNPIRLDDPLLLWGGGEDFVDARDCARANLAALDATAPRQRVYNVATGRSVDLPAFLAAVKAAWPTLEASVSAIPETGFAGFRHRRPAPTDVTAALAELGFACLHDIADSVRYWSHPRRAPDP
ncbi:NAD(P)-dependent oxidoreductase [uncultured Alsobacter sp.]|uniref:NAD-dependent epimerase/dehydratase family protein n=1 Tax=uncultured Alsobacter sp. TaxID=1748258 RepID=UPI0025D17984|nr:NAD(P)-dependent oxidoreductase [uncultured Alsobacter sp.]